jgi:hypothetical protein
MLLKHGRERAIRQVGHDQVGELARLAILVDRHDVGMVKRGGGVGLAMEAGEEDPPDLGVTCELAMNDFHGDMPAGMLLPRQEDRSYSIET